MSNAAESNAAESNAAETALSTALTLLKLGDFQSRWDVAKAISEFGEAAIAPLVSLLQDETEDWELTWFIARILGNLKHPAAIAALVNLIRTTAHEEVAGMATAALTQMGPAAVAPLQTLLTQTSTYRLGVQALAQIRHPNTVPSLLGAMQHESPSLRMAAIDALSHFQHPQISAALLVALQDTEAGVRQSAVTTLGLQAALHDKDELTDCLKPLLWDFNLDVGKQTAIALGRIGTESATVSLFEVLRSPHTPAQLQIEAMRALAWISSIEALSCLQEFLLQSPVSLCQEAISVLGRVEPVEAKPQATQILLNLLQAHPIAQTERGKQAIALSLGQLQQPQALETLIQLLAEPSASVRLHAIAALKQLEATKQLEPQIAQKRLRALAAQDNLTEELRKGVTIALQEWGR